MRLHRFYIDQIVGSNTELTIHSHELVNQVTKVFRLRTKDSLIVFDGSGFDYECIIAGFTKDSISLNVIASARSSFMPSREIYLYAAIVKKDTFEWIVEKATELGVTRIVPILSERTEKKNLNEDRLKKITLEASEQSGRGDVVHLSPIMTLKEAIDSVPPDVSSIVFHPDAELFERKGFEKGPVALFIGPEGGWSPDEIALFHDSKISVKSLGKQILRAETAVIATLSVVMLG